MLKQPSRQCWLGADIPPDSTAACRLPVCRHHCLPGCLRDGYCCSSDAAPDKGWLDWMLLGGFSQQHPFLCWLQVTDASQRNAAALLQCFSHSHALLAAAEAAAAKSRTHLNMKSAAVATAQAQAPGGLINNSSDVQTALSARSQASPDTAMTELKQMLQPVNKAQSHLTTRDTSRSSIKSPGHASASAPSSPTIKAYRAGSNATRSALRAALGSAAEHPSKPTQSSHALSRLRQVGGNK